MRIGSTNRLSTTNDKLEAEQLEIKLQLIAVIFCWVLAAGFYIKKQLKKRRRLRERQAAAAARTYNTRAGGMDSKAR